MRVTPKVRSDHSLRKLYLTRELSNDVNEEKQTHFEVRVFANLIADLEVFVTSPTIDPDYLRCLKPYKDGIWEIRSTRERPQIRTFGVFAAKDTFIGTHYKLRDYLGGKDNEQWKIQMQRTKKIWNDLFPEYTYKTTNDPNKLFTGALDAKHFE